MADREIDELIPATTIQDDDLFVLLQDDKAKQLSGRTLSNYVYAAGAEMISEVEQTVEDAQQAINNLEDQKDAIAETIASMAQLGTDITLTTPGMAADAKAAGDVVKMQSEQPQELANKIWIKPSEEEYELVETKDLGYVTPEMFGAVGDGAHNDTNSVRQALKYSIDYGVKLLLSNKYYITSSLLTSSDYNSTVTINIEGTRPLENYIYALDDYGGIKISNGINLFEGLKLCGSICRVSFMPVSRSQTGACFKDCQLRAFTFDHCSVSNILAFCHNTSIGSCSRITYNRFLTVYYFAKCDSESEHYGCIDSVISGNYINGGSELNDNHCFEWYGFNGSSITNNFIDYYQTIYYPKSESSFSFQGGVSCGNQYQVFRYLYFRAENCTKIFFPSNGDCFNWMDPTTLQKLEDFTHYTYTGHDGNTYDYPPALMIIDQTCSVSIKDAIIQNNCSNLVFIRSGITNYSYSYAELTIASYSLNNFAYANRVQQADSIYNNGAYKQNKINIPFILDLNSLPEIGFGWTNYYIGQKVRVNNRIYEFSAVYENEYIAKWIEKEVVIDSSLTKSGQAADAKVVGDKLNASIKYVTPQMFGAKGDGVTDDTVAFNDALAASHFLFVPDGTYMINAVSTPAWTGGLLPRSDTSIVLSNGATLKALPNSNDVYSIMSLHNVENVSIYGGTIRGEKASHTGSTGEWGFGIYVTSSRNIRISNVNIGDCWGDAICLNDTHDDLFEIENVIIENCILHDCRRQGISLCRGKKVRVTNCEIYNISGTSPQSGIDIEPNIPQNPTPEQLASLTLDDISITGCNIHDVSGRALMAVNAGNVSLLNNLFVSRCVFSGILDFFSGNNIVVSDSVCNKVSFRSNVVFNNCILDSIIVSSGNGKFVNCKIISKNETDAFIYLNNDQSMFRERSDYVEFIGCAFEDGISTGYLLRCPQPDGEGHVHDGKVIFDDCKTNFADGSEVQFMTSYAPSGGIKMTGCDFAFTSAPSSSETVPVIYFRSHVTNPTVEIYDSSITTKNDQRVSYIIKSDVGNTKVFIINSTFYKYIYFMGASNTMSSALVRFYNNYVDMLPNSTNGGNITYVHGDGALNVVVDKANNINLYNN